MGNDGGAVGRNFGGGGAATAKAHQAEVIVAGGGGAVAASLGGPVKGGNLNFGAGGAQVTKAEANAWVRSGGTAGRKPVGALRSKAMDLHQSAKRDAFTASQRRSMGMRSSVARAAPNAISGGGTRPPITTKWTASSRAGAQRQATKLTAALKAESRGTSGKARVSIKKAPNGKGYTVSHTSSMQANTFRGVKVGGRNTPQDRKNIATSRARAKARPTVGTRGRRQPAANTRPR